MTAPANPDEGQVAIPWSRGPARGRRGNGEETNVVVGCLGARAIRWVEETTGKGLDQIWIGVTRSIESGSAAGLRLSDSAVIIWASIEHHRRRSGAPGPEYTVEDADEILEELGSDDFYGIAYNLMYWSAANRRKRAKIEEAAREAGREEGLGELRALAAGIGTPTSEQVSEPASPSEPSGT